MAAWAPLVPYARLRTGVEQGTLGLLLLALGIGSLVAMPVTGTLAGRFGCRPVIMLSGLGCCVALPLLALAPTATSLALALFLFGAALGTLDVAMNIQAVVIEKEHGGALMSGFHGMFSVGGIAGALGMTCMLWAGAGVALAACTMAGLVALVLLAAAPNLLGTRAAPARHGPLMALPRGAVVVIGVLCGLVFLAEGAVLDWSAVFLTSGGAFSQAQGGLGYAAFAGAMTVGRLSGDRIVQRWGGKLVVMVGGAAAALGFVATVLAPSPWLALLGFVLVGLGASNVVPVLFSAAGRQHDMPASAAISAVTTIGYAGILAGPALIGLVAHASSLHYAFLGLAGAMLVVAFNADTTGGQSDSGREQNCDREC